MPSWVKMHERRGMPAVHKEARCKGGPEPRGAAAPAVPVAAKGRTGPEADAVEHRASGFAPAGEDDSRDGRELVAAGTALWASSKARASSLLDVDSLFMFSI